MANAGRSAVAYGALRQMIVPYAALYGRFWARFLARQMH